MKTLATLTLLATATFANRIFMHIERDGNRTVEDLLEKRIQELEDFTDYLKTDVKP